MPTQIRSLIIGAAIALTATLLPAVASAQELLAKITINHNQIQGTDASVFDNLKETLEQFVNDRQWTDYHFQKNERIVCNFNITVTKYDQSTNRFTCSALIQANRPVYNSAYTTTIYNNKDNDFNFEFAQFDQLNFNEEQIDNQLTALFAYYAYLIVGLDLDTFSPMGGRRAAKVHEPDKQRTKPELHRMEIVRDEQKPLRYNKRLSRRGDETLPATAVRLLPHGT